jgi:hypothetical protein
MRLSIVKTDPGYSEANYNARVFFNGEEAANVLTADDETGEIVEYMLDEDGNLMRNESGDSILTRQRFGKVRFIFDAGCGHA